MVTTGLPWNQAVNRLAAGITNYIYTLKNGKVIEKGLTLSGWLKLSHSIIKHANSNLPILRAGACKDNHAN